MVEVPSPKIAKNLPRAYEKLHCKEEPYPLAVSEGLRYTQTDRDLVTLLKKCKTTRITNVKPNKKAHTISMKMFKIQLTIFNYLFTFCA